MFKEKAHIVVNALSGKGHLNLFPSYYEREKWDAIPDNLKASEIGLAEELLDYQWPLLRTSDYLDFWKDGVHTGTYHNNFMQRRIALGKLLVGECIEGKGRFLRDIINGAIHICEESGWIVPQHNHIYELDKMDKKIPYGKTDHIDLFAAETASLLAWCLYFLEEEFHRVSVNISLIIRERLDERLIDRYLRHSDFHWMALAEGSRFPGNWNSWINNNCMIVYLLCCRDREKQSQGVTKVLASIDAYMKGIGDDGGCNEGPGYWNVGHGSVFDMLEILYEATGGKFDFFNDPKIKNMGRYINNMYIGDNRFVPFADAVSKNPGNDGSLQYRWGKAVGDGALISLGKYFAQAQPEIKIRYGNTFRTFRTFSRLFVYREMLEGEGALSFEPDALMSDLQVMTSREKTEESGFFLSMKGGHNHESHNHNDVGNFVVYHDTRPVFIDVGAWPYSLRYFSDERYTAFWVTQSAYHNLPTVNSVMQKFGEEYRADLVEYAAADNVTRYAMNLEKAYPAEADLKSWRREVLFDRKGKAEIRLIDSFEMNKGTDDIALSLVTPRVPVIIGRQVILGVHDGGKDIQVLLDGDDFEMTAERIDITDSEKLRHEWGEDLFRILVKARKAMDRGRIELVIAEIDSFRPS